MSKRGKCKFIDDEVDVGESEDDDNIKTSKKSKQRKVLASDDEDEDDIDKPTEEDRAFINDDDDEDEYQSEVSSVHESEKGEVDADDLLLLKDNEEANQPKSRITRQDTDSDMDSFIEDDLGEGEEEEEEEDEDIELVETLVGQDRQASSVVGKNLGRVPYESMAFVSSFVAPPSLSSATPKPKASWSFLNKTQPERAKPAPTARAGVIHTSQGDFLVRQNGERLALKDGNVRLK